MAFPKQHIPWNKGLKGIHLSPESEFKKGSKSWNTGKAIYSSCKDCGKSSYWIRAQGRCHKCWIKSWAIENENHPRYKKDRSAVVKRQERNDSAYKAWRKSVRDRDGWQCKVANSDCLGKVVAHHILPWPKFPELRYEINNGITLCRSHHPRKRDDEMKLSPYFQQLVISNRN